MIQQQIGFDIELKIEEGLYMTKDLFIDFYRYITQGVSSVKITCQLTY